MFHALGDVDELNSAIGVAQEFCTVDHDEIQQQVRPWLFALLMQRVESSFQSPACLVQADCSRFGTSSKNNAGVEPQGEGRGVHVFNLYLITHSCCCCP